MVLITCINIYVRMYQHLVNNNILINEQFGFRPKSSTTAAAYNLMNEVRDNNNNNNNNLFIIPEIHQSGYRTCQ